MIVGAPFDGAPLTGPAALRALAIRMTDYLGHDGSVGASFVAHAHADTGDIEFGSGGGRSADASADRVALVE